MNIYFQGICISDVKSLNAQQIDVNSATFLNFWTSLTESQKNSVKNCNKIT